MLHVSFLPVLLHCLLCVPCDPWVCCFAVLETSSPSRTGAASPVSILSPGQWGGRASRVAAAAAAAALGSQSSLLAPRAGHSRAGLEAMLLPHLAPSLCCPRATWPPASVMVTGDVCCQCRSLWRTLGRPGSTTGFLRCYCSSCFVSSYVQMEKARERRWKRERLAFKTTRR